MKYVIMHEIRAIFFFNIGTKFDAMNFYFLFYMRNIKYRKLILHDIQITDIVYFKDQTEQQNKMLLVYLMHKVKECHYFSGEKKIIQKD